ncbi:Aldo/keto reductase family-domain-containing protein [Coniella lustricola]|uniref:Aldo/keto reductase family-domain-containing protein n=1 Tax=Coniella lustricola TaxID=2025994 RepID=A0A2T2ZW66_9PEZI|nr:Aldo/keto reductase family-domain-containing protein [Coniella lustricola]
MREAACHEAPRFLLPRAITSIHANIRGQSTAHARSRTPSTPEKQNTTSKNATKIDPVVLPRPAPPTALDDKMASTAEQAHATRASLPSQLPPLILGTATFNTQYVDDPARMPYTSIVSRALDLGVNAFDTSPYYGPSEILLGDALHHLTTPNSANAEIADSTTQTHARESYMILTKAGRIAGDSFDYSPAWIRYSVLRSLKRLHTPYLDLVYCHDVEFVSPAEVLAAVKELRRLRDQDGVIRHVGISGYPVDVLCELAEMIKRETGEPVDAVMSYCHCTVQNHRLVQGFMGDEPEPASSVASAATPTEQLPPLVRLKRAGVSTVLNASMLGMGLLTTRGVDHGPQAAWHPSPPPLRKACADMAAAATAANEKLERLAIRWSLDTFARAGARAGLGVSLQGKTGHLQLSDSSSIGGSVMGITSLAELEETWDVWMSVLAESVPSVSLDAAVSKEAAKDVVVARGETDDLQTASLKRCDQVQRLVKETLWPLLGEWRNHSWSSGGKDFVNDRNPEDMGVVPTDDGILAEYEANKKPT